MDDYLSPNARDWVSIPNAERDRLFPHPLHNSNYRLYTKYNLITHII